ncbi:MAG: hypothetical protein IKJ18_04990 [Bacteroidaceae bacterium]|nr:hypothetical protein [Bacteroidaceae bacterium]
MKRNLIFIVLLLAIVSPCRSQYENDCFKLSVGTSQKLALNTQTISKDSTLAIDISTPIYGLSISGTSTSPNENSLLRVILKDTHGREYLVYETNSLLSSTSSSSFSNVGIETLSLDGIIPESLQLYVTDGSIMLDKLHYTTTPPALKERSATALSASEIRLSQTKAIVEQMNENLRNQNKMWRAGVTDIALMSYEEKKTLWGNDIPNLHGLEYYRGGIFNLSDIITGGSLPNEDTIQNYTSSLLDVKTVTSRTSNSPYVHEFDWRNRHGKNWITPAKQQYGLTCWAFASVALVETYTNLYYNRGLNYDLSEQEIISCENETYNPHDSEGFTSKALSYIKSRGIVDEECFPLSPIPDETSTCDEKGENPQDIITIEEFAGSYNNNEETYKHLLIKHPIGYSCWNSKGGHSIILVGYKVIEIGDIIYYDPVTGAESIVVDEDSKLCGKTAWICKNSWGENWGYDGFGYFVTDKLNSEYHFYLKGSIFSEMYNDDNIVCEDADGDGFFWWGIGEKPSDIPTWAQEEADGDDSNPHYGSMDEYGHLQEISSNDYPEIIINTDTTWYAENYIYNNVRIVNGGKLTITADINMYFTSEIIVESGGQLIIDSGSITRSNIIVRNGGKITIAGNGKLRLSDADSFRVEQGGILNQSFGKIEITD